MSSNFIKISPLDLILIYLKSVKGENTKIIK